MDYRPTAPNNNYYDQETSTSNVMEEEPPSTTMDLVPQNSVNSRPKRRFCTLVDFFTPLVKREVPETSYMEAEAPRCSSDPDVVDMEPPPMEPPPLEPIELGWEWVEMPSATNLSNGNLELSRNGASTTGIIAGLWNRVQISYPVEKETVGNERLCLVCNSRGIICNYRRQGGVYACTKCVEFFNAFKAYGDSTPFFCYNYYYCQINSPDPSSTCKDCWLQMCFKVGFNLDGPWSPISTREKKYLRMDLNRTKCIQLNNELPSFVKPCPMLLAKITRIYLNAFRAPANSLRINENWFFLETINDMPPDPTLLRVTNNIVGFIVQMKGLKNFDALSLIQKHNLVSLLLIFHAVLNYTKVPQSTHDYVENRIKELVRENQIHQDNQLNMFLYIYRRIGCNAVWLDKTEHILCWAILALNPMLGELPKQDIISHDQLLDFLASYEFEPDNFKPKNRFTDVMQFLHLIKALAFRFFDSRCLVSAFNGCRHNEKELASLLSLFNDKYISHFFDTDSPS